MTSVNQALPFPEFPLRRHRSGQWYKNVWNPRTQRSETFYFGSYHEDPRGDDALNHPVTGWLARREAIKSGCDNTRIEPPGAGMLLGEVMQRFLEHKRDKTRTGELSLTTLDGYLHEVGSFVAFMKPTLPPAALRPEHFSAYMRGLASSRQLGRHARRRARAYVMAFLRFGAKNGWYAMPNTGVDWAAPSTCPDAMRQSRAREGTQDFSERILAGSEIDQLLARSSPLHRAMILLGVNCGFGPADLGRLRWRMLDLATGLISYPRGKTGVPRRGYLWKKTRRALQRVQKLKHCRRAIENDGENALVLLTRTGQAVYRESEVIKEIMISGESVQKLVGVKVENAVSQTFGRLARKLKLEGVSFYRLRHTFKTFGKKARDKEALDLMMGHRPADIGSLYDHELIDQRRVRRVARHVLHALWPKIKRRESNAAPAAVAAD